MSTSTPYASATCEHCSYFQNSENGYCKAFFSETSVDAGSDCTGFYRKGKVADPDAVLTPAERLLRNWLCFKPAIKRGNPDKHIIPLLVTGESQTYEAAFTQFCRLSLGSLGAIPLFLTLHGIQKPDALPEQLVLSIFELKEAPSRCAALLTSEMEFSAWKLLETVFPCSPGRAWLLQAEPPSEVCSREFRIGNILLPRPLNARGASEEESQPPTLPSSESIESEWGALFENPPSSEDVRAVVAMSAMLELNAKGEILVLDDLVGRQQSAPNQHEAWTKKRKALEQLFNVADPVLPVLQRHFKNPDELLPVIRAEITRLSRPLAAVVDLNWLSSDTGERNASFGLELVRLIREAKPSLPIFIWSPIHDKAVLQKAMQLGASSYFDKEPELVFGHEEDGDSDSGEVKSSARKAAARLRSQNLLTPGKLWIRILKWEMTRYQLPPVEGCGRSFLLDETRDTRKERQEFLKTFDLTEAKLLAKEEPDIERLLRALVPDAEQVEILRFFGEGRSGSEPPFIVRGRTRSKRWLRPVQIKVSKDWRALAREGKGYRDVFAGALGPSVAHLEAGPYRLNEWSAMCQSFAAPEEAIREIGTKSTRSLSDWLRKNLWKPKVCSQLVDELFDGVLDPFYKGNLEKREESVVRAFDRVSPAHLETLFKPVSEEKHMGDSIDLTPETLSRKNEKARREAAYRQWQRLEEWYAKNEQSVSIAILGLVIDRLEVDDADPKEWRLRLLDRTLGVKIDLKAGDHDVARRWKALADSPIKLRGLPVAFRLEKKLLKESLGEGRLLQGWGRSVLNKLIEAGIAQALPVDGGNEATQTESLEATKAEEPKPVCPDGNGTLDQYTTFPKEAADRIAAFFYPIHPLDWSEEFHVGPTHGDLNLGNILLHKKGESFFPWLIDFDKAEVNRPVVFDLAKLEIEAYHKIGQELYWELAELGCLGDDPVKRDQRLLKLLYDFENCLERKGIETIDHLWERFEKAEFVPESLRLRFEGFFAYLRQVHRRVFELGITPREFLIGRAVYCFCCIKFKHIYEAKSHPNAPFPAKVLVCKLESMLDALDAMNGIQEKGKTSSPQATLICEAIKRVRDKRSQGSTATATAVLGADETEWTALLKALRDKALPGERLWFREILWHARDYGVAKTSEELAAFTRAIAVASTKNGKPESLTSFSEIAPALKDYASTGRFGNVYPTREMFRVLAETDEHLIKMSSRGESGGTIDILDQAGVALCKSASAVEAELKARGWAVASASKDICEVDKILMDLRKKTNCMKVTDLVIASISAKKLALGIQSFDIEVATGYDAKILDQDNYLSTRTLKNGSATSNLKMWWLEVWQEAATGGLVECLSFFDTNQLQSWLDETVGESNSGKPDMVVFGSTLLAANIWRLNPKWHPKLLLRMPAEFCKKMGDYAKLLDRIDAEVLQQWPPTDETIQNAGQAGEKKTKPPRPIFRLDDIDRPAHLHDVICWAVDDFTIDCEEMRDIRVVFYRFSDKFEDIGERVVIEFFDSLYSDISKQGGNELTSFVFAKNWMALLLPRAVACNSEFNQCWKVLRDGFRWEEQVGK